MFNIITGVYDPTEGDISFLGKSVVPYKPYQGGRAWNQQNVSEYQAFSSLSVRDNTEFSFVKNLNAGFFSQYFRSKSFLNEEKGLNERIDELLEHLVYLDSGEESAKSLPYGEQRKVEIVRALATSLNFCCDEPAGMNPTEKIELMNLIKMVKDNLKFPFCLLNTI